MRYRATPALIGLALISFCLGLASPSVSYGAKALDGRCGMHIGGLLRRTSVGSTYDFRIGPKDYNLGSVHPTTCRGQVRVQLRGKGQVGALAWQSYLLKGFNRHAALLVVNGGLTAVGCGGVAKVMVTSIGAFLDGATEGIAFPVVATSAGLIGCGIGTHALVSLLPDGPNTLDGIRMVK